MNSTVTHNQSQYTPNTNLLRMQGWSIISTYGPYCSAWKGSLEILLIWRNGNWQKVLGYGAMSY